MGSAQYERQYRLTDLEVENQSLRNQLIALNFRKEVITDLQSDVSLLRG